MAYGSPLNTVSPEMETSDPRRAENRPWVVARPFGPHPNSKARMMLESIFLPADRENVGISWNFDLAIDEGCRLMHQVYFGQRLNLELHAWIDDERSRAVVEFRQISSTKSMNEFITKGSRTRSWNSLVGIGSIRLRTRAEGSNISTGTIASTPNAKLNGLSPTDLFGVVSYGHKTDGPVPFFQT